MMRHKIIMGMVMGLFLCLTNAGAEEPKEITATKTVTGEVSGISSNFIAIMYGVDSKNEASLEMALTVDKKVEIEHKDSLKDIRVGDTVAVTYEEKFQKDEKGNLSRVNSRIAKKITFLKAAQRIEETGALVSQE